VEFVEFVDFVEFVEFAGNSPKCFLVFGGMLSKQYDISGTLCYLGN